MKIFALIFCIFPVASFASSENAEKGEQSRAILDAYTNAEHT